MINSRTLYTKLAKYYDLLAPSTTKQECIFLDKIFQKFGNGQIRKVLDLGCGTGRHTSLLQKMGYKVTGIDLSDQMLDMARQKSPASIFLKMDFCSPEFEENFFDASICMWSTIGYILEEEKFKEFIKNVAKVTKKIFVFSSTNHEKEDFQTDEKSEKVILIPDGQIKATMVRHYDRETGIRDEKYEYRVIERGKETRFLDKNKLRLWKIDEIKKLLFPEFEILNIYGDYSTKDLFNIKKSDKKIIVCRKK